MPAAITTPKTNTDPTQGLPRTNILRRILLAASLLCAIALPAAANEQIVVEVGKGVLLDGSELTESVFVADTSIADANLSPTESIFLFGKSVGETSLIGAALDGSELFHYTVIVTHAMSEIRGNLSQRFPGEAISLESSRGSVMVAGVVSSEQVRENVIRTLEAGIPSSAIIDQLTVSSSNLIRLHVRLLEVNRSRAKRYGIDWSGTIAENGFFVGAQQGGVLRLGYNERARDSLSATIDLLVSNDIATIVQETSLSTVAGQEALFSVGGEIPVPRFISAEPDGGNAANYSLDYKFIGTELAFSPTRAPGNKLRLGIQSSVSSAQPTSSVVNGNTFPNLNTRSFQTQVELADGQSFIIAGLSRNESLAALRDSDGRAGSGLVNRLFGSDRVSDGSKELVVIVTPQLTEPEIERVAEKLVRRPSNLEFLLSGDSGKGGNGTRRIPGKAGFIY